MRVFLVALAGIFATIAQFWDATALLAGGYGPLGQALSIAFYDLSIQFSDAAQLSLDGAVAADDLRKRIDDIQDGLTDALLESALGEALTSLLPTFPELVATPGQWVVDRLSELFPVVAEFFDDPEAWVLALLEQWLPIDIQASGFETMSVDGNTFYFNHDTSVGSGFQFVVPEGGWTAIWATFFGLVSTSPPASLNVFRNGVLVSSFPGPPGMLNGQAFGVSIAADPEGLTVGDTWRVLASTPGSMAFQEFISLQPAPGEIGWGVAPITLVGNVGPASWSLDWSGFIDWLEEAFLSVAGSLYALLERIVRYFWEGVY